MIIILRCGSSRSWRVQSMGAGLPSSGGATRPAAIPIFQWQRQSRPISAMTSCVTACSRGLLSVELLLTSTSGAAEGVSSGTALASYEQHLAHRAKRALSLVAQSNSGSDPSSEAQLNLHGSTAIP